MAEERLIEAERRSALLRWCDWLTVISDVNTMIALLPS
jgi:hypothetical protein